MQGLTLTDSSYVDLTKISGPVSAFITIDGRDVSARVDFLDHDLALLTPGQYVYDDGTVSAEPCGMKDAESENG